MPCSMPGLPVHHQLPELAKTHVHQVGDAIQPSHLLSSPSPATFNLSQNQGLFQWVSSSHQVAKVLEFQLQHQSFQWIFRAGFPLGWVKVKVKSLSRVWRFAPPWTVAYQASLSMAFSRQEYWSGLPFPSPGDLPDPGIEPRSPASEADALPSEPPGMVRIKKSD